MNIKDRNIINGMIIVAAFAVMTAVAIPTFTKSTQNKEAGAQQRYFDARKLIPDFDGKTEAEVISVLGESYGKIERTPSDGFPEVFIELHNLYPPESPESEGVIIRMLFWELPDINVAVALHKVDDKWIVLKTRKWPKYVMY